MKVELCNQNPGEAVSYSANAVSGKKLSIDLPGNRHLDVEFLAPCDGDALEVCVSVSNPEGVWQDLVSVAVREDGNNASLKLFEIPEQDDPSTTTDIPVLV